MIPTWKGSKLTSNVQRLQVNVKRFKVNIQRFKVTHAAWGQNLSTSAHFHHVAGISINYRRGENSMNVAILNQNNSTISTTLSSSCFNSNSSVLHLLFCKNLRLHKTHRDHHLSKLLPWLHQVRIVHIHCSHPLNRSSLHIHHGTSLNQTLSMSSRKKHLHVEIRSGTVLSWQLICNPKEWMPSVA